MQFLLALRYGALPQNIPSCPCEVNLPATCTANLGHALTHFLLPYPVFSVLEFHKMRLYTIHPFLPHCFCSDNYFSFDQGVRGITVHFFFPIGTWHPIMEIYHNLFIHSAIIEEFLAIMNKVLNVQVQILMGTYILISWGKCLGIQLPGHGECMLRFIRSFQTVFQSVCGIFVVLTEMYSSPSGSKSLSTLNRVNLFNFSYFSGCIVIFLCGFTLDDPEHPFFS